MHVLKTMIRSDKRQTMYITKISVSFLFLSSVFSGGVALASSCINPTYQQFRLNQAGVAGSRCWEYEGKATHFSGDFAQGQEVAVTMEGIAFYGTANGKADSRWERRYPSISGPNRFIKVSSPGNNPTWQVELPYTGRYTFSFSPCAMWHGDGNKNMCVSH